MSNGLLWTLRHPLCALEGVRGRLRLRWGGQPPPPSEAAGAAHEAALESGRETYTDPENGRLVYTSAALLTRAECCGLGCRHCPFPNAS